MTTFRRILAGAAFSVIVASVASASTLTQTFSLPNTQTDILGTTGTGTFQNFLSDCPTCNAAWLQSVTIEVAVNENLTSLTLTNLSSASNTFEYQTYSGLTLQGTAPTADKGALSFDLFNNTPAFAAGNNCTAQPAVIGANIDLCDTGNVTYTGNQTISYGPVTAGNDTGVQSAASIVPYDTTGSFTLGFNTLTHQSFIGGGGQDTNSQTTTANGTITVIYQYNDPSGAPEPATLFLMGSALVGVGLLRKRLKA